MEVSRLGFEEKYEEWDASVLVLVYRVNMVGEQDKHSYVCLYTYMLNTYYIYHYQKH